MTILLRPWTEADAPGLRDAIDEDVDHLRPWLNWTLSEPATLARTQDRLRDWVEQYRTGRGFRWAIVTEARPDSILGGANLNCRFGPTAHDVGYWVRRSAAGQGMAGAATARLVVHAFSRPDIERLIIQADVVNLASAAVARSLGFELTDTLTIEYDDGRPRPIHRFEMTRSHYRTRERALRDRSRNVRLITQSRPDLPAGP
jgi:RimJ/RimL family protein N-acetyltransferase